jgi:hypothetical protein
MTSDRGHRPMPLWQRPELWSLPRHRNRLDPPPPGVAAVTRTDAASGPSGKDRRPGLLAPLAFAVTAAAVSVILIAWLGLKLGVPIALLVTFLNGYAMGTWDSHRIGLRDDLLIVWARKLQQMLRSALRGRADE